MASTSTKKNATTTAAAAPVAVNSTSSPLLSALMKHQVSAKVTDCDHHRIHGGLAVESDYIITVQPAGGSLQVEPFCISKTYSAFRTLAQQLKTAADMCRRSQQQVKAVKKSNHDNDDDHDEQARAVSKVLKYCDLVYHWIDSQRTAYLGKVNYMYVKILAKQRQEILDNVLAATVQNFPAQAKGQDYFLDQVATLLETFFLTDHVLENLETAAAARGTTPPPPRSSSTSDLQPSPPRRGANHHRTTHSATSSLNSNKSEKEQGNNAILSWINAATKVAAGGVKKSPLKNNKSPPLPSSSSSDAHRSTVVVPLTRRPRDCESVRLQEDEELQTLGDEARLLVDDDRTNTISRMAPSYGQPVPTVRIATSSGHSSGGSSSSSVSHLVGLWLETNPWLFVAIALVALAFLQKAAESAVRMDGDLFCLAIFGSFCLGLHTPRPMVGGYDRPTAMKGTIAVSGKRDESGRKLLRRSMMRASVSPMMARRRTSERPTSPDHPSSPLVGTATSIRTPIDAIAEEAELADDEMLLLEDLASFEEEEESCPMGSPMAKFPEGAAIGSHFNCWSSPNAADFLVRGPKYTVDKKKIPSSDFLFPCRGLDLFLTDACPQNVGRNPGVFGGRLREVPTFIINFRLPWGVLLFYCEIPMRFVPFIEAQTVDERQQLEPQLQAFSPPERTVARWLLADAATKNQTLKIVPVVVDGPWVVKSVVGGKPALIGAKLPIDYVYQPADNNNGKPAALYVEADLDIAASSAARGILSVTRSYTQVLTLNIGFVIQGNLDDELPERMLMGARLHGIDPLTAPSLPPMEEDLILPSIISTTEDDDESV